MSIEARPPPTSDEIRRDFDLPWCHKLLAEPKLSFTRETIQGTLFAKLLCKPGALQAHLQFRRLTREPDAVNDTEDCMLLSVGSDLDGMAGRAHGGFSSLILDQLGGSCANQAVPNAIPPATATLTVDFKAPVLTPCVVLARAWVVEITGRKTWIQGVLQDGDGKVFATARGLFIAARTTSL